MSILLRRLYHQLKWLLPQPNFIVSFTQDKRIRRVADQVNQIASSQPSPKTILYIPSYYQMTFTRLFDLTMVMALRLRGVKVIPVLAGGFFPHEDVIFGGIYNEFRQAKRRSYQKIEQKIWVDLLRTQPIYLGDYLSNEDEQMAQKLGQAVTLENCQTITFQNYPVGEKAMYATLNLNNMAALIEDNKILFQLKEHTQNIVKLLLVYKKILAQHQPETIFSEFPHYYQWHTAYFVARKLGINFYGWVVTEKKNSCFFAKNSDSFLDPTPAWSSFKKQPVSKKDQELLEKGIAARVKRTVSHAQVYPTQAPPQVMSEFWQRLDPKKPIAFFPVNVFFDLAVFKKSPAFKDLLDMLKQTIAFFNEHPEYQLILKAHPAEKLFYNTTYKQATEYCLRNVLKKYNLELGKNIIFLDYNTPISAFDLIPQIDLGIVYTSTTTVEMAWLGKPVIAVSDNHYLGKGFTFEPKNVAEFEKFIKNLLLKEEKPSIVNERIELSKKYYLLYYYHAFINFGLFEGNDSGSIKNRFLVENYQQLLPGKNPALDYICQAVINGDDIYGTKQWPPLTI